MEIAQAFMIAKKEGFGPRRSILIMAVSGEEKGLLGSKYYTKTQFSLKKNGSKFKYRHDRQNWRLSRKNLIIFI